MRRPVVPIGKVLFACILLASCGSSGNQAGGSSTSSTVNGKTAGDILASKDAAFKGDQFHLDVTSLRRSGDLMTLSMLITFNGGGTRNASLTGAMAYTDSSYKGTALNGVYLIDPINKKKYQPARDSNGVCVCTDLVNVNIAPKESAVLTATYAAPPAEVKSLDLYLPTFGSFTGVPLS